MLTLAAPLSASRLHENLPANIENWMEKLIDEEIPREADPPVPAFALMRAGDHDDFALDMQRQMSSHVRDIAKISASHSANPSELTPRQFKLIKNALHCAVLNGANHAVCEIVADEVPYWFDTPDEFREFWKSLNEITQDVRKEVIPGPDMLRKKENHYLEHVNGSFLEMWKFGAPGSAGSSTTLADIILRSIPAVYAVSLARAFRLLRTIAVYMENAQDAYLLFPPDKMTSSGD